MATLTASIDPTKNRGQYQPLAAYSCKQIRGGITQDDRAANDEAREAVRDALEAAGFREYTANPGAKGWYSADCSAQIVARYPCDLSTATLGIQISRQPLLAALVTHELDGTYDALPLAEKHRLSGAGGTLESWLELFDRCGKRRPQ